MSAWVLTWVVSVGPEVHRSLFQSQVEAVWRLERSVVRPESTLTTRLTLGAPPAVIVPSFQVTVLLMPLWVPPPVAEQKLVPAGIWFFRSSPRASVRSFPTRRSSDLRLLPARTGSGLSLLVT